jgi:fructose-1-phosphate kinase PfkB-like protein
MTPYVRIKEYVINLQNVAFIRVADTRIDFGLVENYDGRNYIRFEKGVDLQEAEFEQVREFVLDLPDPDRVIVV